MHNDLCYVFNVSPGQVLCMCISVFLLHVCIPARHDCLYYRASTPGIIRTVPAGGTTMESLGVLRDFIRGGDTLPHPKLNITQLYSDLGIYVPRASAVFNDPRMFNLYMIFLQFVWAVAELFHDVSCLTWGTSVLTGKDILSGHIPMLKYAAGYECRLPTDLMEKLGISYESRVIGMIVNMCHIRYTSNQ